MGPLFVITSLIDGDGSMGGTAFHWGWGSYHLYKLLQYSKTLSPDWCYIIFCGHIRSPMYTKETFEGKLGQILELLMKQRMPAQLT